MTSDVRPVMRSAHVTDGAHARGAGGAHAGDAVLHHHAIQDCRAHLPGGKEKHVRRRLAVRDLRGAEYIGRELVPKTHQLQGRLQLGRRAAGGHADLQAALAQHANRLQRAGQRAQFLAEDGFQPVRVFARKAFGQAAGVFLLQGPPHVRVGNAGEAARGVLGRDGDAMLGQRPRLGARRDDLAIDQDAVAVEDDQAGGRRMHGGSISGQVPMICLARDTTARSAPPTSPDL